MFMDEFSHLAEDDATVGGKAEQELQECYSFTYMHAGDGQGDKEKPCIGCIDWFPGAKDVVAVSLVSSSKLDDRVSLKLFGHHKTVLLMHPLCVHFVCSWSSMAR